MVELQDVGVFDSEKYVQIMTGDQPQFPLTNRTRSLKFFLARNMSGLPAIHCKTWNSTSNKLASWHHDFYTANTLCQLFCFHPLATQCVGECRYRLGCWLPYTQLPCEKKKRHHHLQRRSVCPHVRLGLNTNHSTILTGWTNPHLKTQPFVSVFFFTYQPNKTSIASSAKRANANFSVKRF